MASSNGFAEAVQPIADHTIHTDDSGLTTGDIHIQSFDIEAPAYYARPAEGTNLPTVIVVQEIFGVHEHIRDVVRRFAKRGYLAIAPYLYERLGDVSGISDFQEILTNFVAKTPDSQVMTDIDAAFAWAEGNGGSDPARRGITGFCWGGRIAWLYAAHSDTLKAAVAWYGRLNGDRTALQPKFPVDVVAQLQAPVLGLYGGEDHGITQESVEQMRGEIEKAHKPSDIVVYPDAGHAFYADYRPSYKAEWARDAETRMFAWFVEHGLAPDK